MKRLMYFLRLFLKTAHRPTCYGIFALAQRMAPVDELIENCSMMQKRARFASSKNEFVWNHRHQVGFWCPLLEYVPMITCF